jgi:hypothetical protein
MEQAVKRPFEGWASIDGVVHWGDAYGFFGQWDIAMDQAVVSVRDRACK